MSINKDSQKAPNLRFKGFTDDWEQRELSQLVEINSGRDYKHLNSGNIPVYGTGGLMLFVDKALSYDEDGIGIGRKGTIDKPYILKAPFWTVDTLFYCIPKGQTNIYFGHAIFQKINWKSKDESTGVPSLSKKNISTVKIYSTKYEEQEKIGLLFKLLDNNITLHQRKLDQLNQLKEALLQQMFPGKGETVPKLRFAGFEGDWEDRKFDEFLEEFIRKSKIENEFTTLSSTNSGMEVREGRVSGDTNIGYKIIENDDLVLSPQNLWLGNINLNYIGTGLVSPSYKTFKIKNLSSSFLKPQLRSKRLLNQYELASTQGASVVRRNLDMELFYQITLPVPVIQEQYKIEKLFKDLDDYIVLQSQKVNKLKSMKEVLLQNMFI